MIERNNLYFENKDIAIDYLIGELADCEGEMQVICDLYTVNTINGCFDLEDFCGYFATDIQSDVNVYSIYKYSDRDYIIEPAKYNDKFLDFELDETPIFIMLDVIHPDMPCLDTSENLTVVSFGDDECDLYCDDDDEDEEYCDCYDCESEDCFNCDNNEDELFEQGCCDNCNDCNDEDCNYRDDDFEEDCLVCDISSHILGLTDEYNGQELFAEIHEFIKYVVLDAYNAGIAYVLED